MENLNENVTEAQETDTQERTYSQAEVDELLQKETDRRVTSALKKAQEKNDAKIREAQRLAAMNADEKRVYDLEQRERAIEAKERELSLAENKSECISILADKGLPVQLVDFVVDEDADTMSANIKQLDKYFKLAVKAEVEKRLASKSPATAPLEQRQSLTKKDIANMSIFELQQLKEEQPDLFK